MSEFVRSSKFYLASLMRVLMLYLIFFKYKKLVMQDKVASWYSVQITSVRRYYTFLKEEE